MTNKDFYVITLNQFITVIDNKKHFKELTDNGWLLARKDDFIKYVFGAIKPEYFTSEVLDLFGFDLDKIDVNDLIIHLYDDTIIIPNKIKMETK